MRAISCHVIVGSVGVVQALHVYRRNRDGAFTSKVLYNISE